jgi:hypothetical protein
VLGFDADDPVFDEFAPTLFVGGFDAGGGLLALGAGKFGGFGAKFGGLGGFFGGGILYLHQYQFSRSIF